MSATKTSTIKLQGIDPKIALARVLVHTDRIRRAVGSLVEDQYASMVALEALGYHAVSDGIDLAIASILSDLDNIEASARASVTP